MKSNVYLAFGPPGTGKTTSLSRWLEKQADIYGSRNLSACSYTRAAAVRLSTATSLDKNQVGTIHSFAYRALGCPDLAEKHVKDWNETHAKYKFSGANKNTGQIASEDYSGATRGDQLLGSMDILRANMTPRDSWSKVMHDFSAAWDDWKAQNDYADFTDLLERCLRDVDTMPGNPAVSVVDESQDCTKLQINLALKWGRQMQKIMLAGDDDQCLFRFCGADPTVLLELARTLPDDHRTVLKQSWRVPRAVHALANGWISKAKERYPKEYLPRDEDGVVRRLSANYVRPERILDDAERVIAAGGTAMILASCSYMLDNLKAVLHKRGLPFHNPYRVERGDWNPLLPGSKKVKAVDRVLAFLRENPDAWGDEARPWTKDDFWRWASCLASKGLLKHGAKEKIADFKGQDDRVEFTDLMDVFLDEEAGGLAAVSFSTQDKVREALAWFQGNCLKEQRKKLAFASKVAAERGPAAIREEPKLVVGTVHCSPGDEPVLTVNRGYVPIAELIEGFDRLPSYYEKNNTLANGSRKVCDGYRAGYGFVRAENYYQGDMLTIITAKSKTRITPSHHVQVRFSESFMEKYVVYLMQRGEWWRVGICVSAHRPYRSGGVGGRLGTEQADKGWILKVCQTREEALMEEAKIQGRFGIPGLTFESSKNRALTREQLYSIHEHTKNEVSQRVLKLLKHFDLNKEWPLYTRATPGGDVEKRNLRSIFLTRAANLLSGYMEFPSIPQSFVDGTKTQKAKPEWLPLTITRNHFDGKVYSLDVEKYHHYISGGALVHNSVKGGEATHVYLVPDLSLAGMKEWGGRGRDSVRRLFYVGMTRASKELILCSSATAHHVRIGKS